MPLTNAPDDSDYVGSSHHAYDLTDIRMTLRILLRDNSETAQEWLVNEQEIGADLVTVISDQIREMPQLSPALSNFRGEGHAVTDDQPSPETQAQTNERLFPEASAPRRTLTQALRGRLSDQEMEDVDAVLGERPAALILTEEMSLPPEDAYPRTRLNLWQAEMQRDLVAEVRADLRNALINGYDMLGSRTDAQVMCDIQECAAPYEDIPDDVMLAAIAEARRIGVRL